MSVVVEQWSLFRALALDGLQLRLLAPVGVASEPVSLAYRQYAGYGNEIKDPTLTMLVRVTMKNLIATAFERPLRIRKTPFVYFLTSNI